MICKENGEKSWESPANLLRKETEYLESLSKRLCHKKNSRKKSFPKRILASGCHLGESATTTNFSFFPKKKEEEMGPLSFPFVFKSLLRLTRCRRRKNKCSLSFFLRNGGECKRRFIIKSKEEERDGLSEWGEERS